MKALWSADYFHDEKSARRFLVSKRWPDGPVCPKCQSGGSRVAKLGGKAGRSGHFKCYECLKPFTVSIGTAFEASHVDLHRWLQATCLLAAPDSKISVTDLHEMLGIARRTAWQMKRKILRILDRPLVRKTSAVQASPPLLDSPKADQPPEAGARAAPAPDGKNVLAAFKLTPADSNAPPRRRPHSSTGSKKAGNSKVTQLALNLDK